MKRALARLLTALAAILVAASATYADPKFVLPKGFNVSRAVSEQDIQFPMFACFDESGALYVAESSGGDLYAELQQQTKRCRITHLSAVNEQGNFKKATVFSDKLVFPMGLAWRGNKLYVADPPDLVALEDTDHDGQADRRTVILTGFGHTDNGSLHGLIFGPDGWLYMTTGRPDGYNLKRADGSILNGTSGALLRCRPDGSDVEVVSRGFENLVEVVFLPGGEIIGTDNWFSLPAAGIRDALVHLVPGGLYPLNKEDGTTQFVSGEFLPAIAKFPAVALSGLARYRAATFPADYRDALFSAQHNSRKVARHKLERLGSTFRSIDEDFLTTDDPDFHPSDVLEDADGSLLICDTGSWYVHHCPTGRIRKTTARGGIYRVRYSGSAFPKDARGLSLDWVAVSTQELVDRLEDIRPAVRERAAAALLSSSESAIDPLQQLIQATDSIDAREEGVWILAQMSSQGAMSILRRELQGRDPQTIILAARALGRLRDKEAAPRLQALLGSPLPAVRLAAAEALAYCGNGLSVSSLVQALTPRADRFIEHALVHALYHLAARDQIHQLLVQPVPMAQKAALILLDQPPHQSLPSEEILKRLCAEDESIRSTARFILKRHPAWISQAVPVMRETLFGKDPLTNDVVTLRELFLAFGTDRSVAKLMAEGIASTSQVPDALQGMIVETMRHVSVKEIPGEWINALRIILQGNSARAKAEAIQTIKALRIPAFEAALMSIARNRKESGPLRIAALQTGLQKNSTLQQEEFGLVLAQLDRRENGAQRLSAIEVLNLATMQTGQFQQLLKAVADDPLISPVAVLALAQRSRADAATGHALVQYITRAIESNWSIPQEQIAWLSSIAPAADKQVLDEIQRKVSRPQADQLAELKRFEKLLDGGEPLNGRNVFFGKAGCSACHRVGDEGGIVGPDLTRIGSVRSERDLVESIIFPSATFAQGYEPYRVTLTNGEELTGIRARQNDESFVLRDALGTDYRPAQNSIQKIEQLKVSLMPEGLMSALNYSEVQHLFAFLQSLK